MVGLLSFQVVEIAALSPCIQRKGVLISRMGLPVFLPCAGGAISP
jgi:ABC-type transport system involved in cytochrome c biogenesis permease component